MKVQQKKPNKVKKWFLAIGIAIIFVLFVNYAISAVFNQPDYNKYCKPSAQPVINQGTNDTCIANGGQWIETNSNASQQPTGYCNSDFVCGNQYNLAQTAYDNAAFITKIIAGLIGLVLGVAIVVESVSAGFLLGAVINLFFATVQYWDRFSNIIRVIILGVVLAILIWVGYKKIK